MSVNEIERLRNLAASYARRKLGKRNLGKHNLGVDHNDLAQDAIEDYLRLWRPNICSAESYVCMRIKHRLYKIGTRADTRGISYGYADNVVHIHDPHALPDQHLENKQEQQRRDELLAYIQTRHPVASKYANHILSNPELTRRQVAALMDVSATHIDYLNRVLRTLVEEFSSLSEAQ
jgi:hypothetical protein